MINKPLKIYLAGKVRGNKWELAKCFDNDYLSSDGSKHSEHLLGLSYCWLSPASDLIGHRSWLIERVMDSIKESDFLFAYLDTSDSYGSIAEIAYASAIGKQCYVIINNQKKEDLAEEDRFYDAYWFITSFPRVIPLEGNLEFAKEVLIGLSKIESEIELKLYNKMLFEGYIYKHKIETQKSIGKYRADFVIDEKIVLELDGHDYHSSREQRTYDAKRDRQIISEYEYKVLRFTGTEIWNDIDTVMKELNKFPKTRGSEL